MNNNKTILVTGGAGYVGSVLVPKLLAKGYSVRVFDKLIFGDFGLEAVKDRIELIQGDILDPPKDLMTGVFGVIHLAGLSSQAGFSFRSPRYTDRANHLGTEIIARLAKFHKVSRFVFASSCSIYCYYKYLPSSAALPLYKEDDSVDVVAPYALSKRAAEEALFELADDSFQPVILRKGTLYGFSPKMRYDLVLNAFTKDAFSQKQITVNAAGEVYRPMVDIRDAVAAYIVALELPLAAVGGKIFNIANGNYRIGDLAEDFRKILKDEKAIDIAIDIKPFETSLNYQADNSRFKEVFQFTPTRVLKDAILELWDALEKGNDYKDTRYYNDPWYKEAALRGLL